MSELADSEKILLVDDNPANLKLLSQMLDEQGFGVRAVKSGERALESVEATPPNLILLDIRMPKMDGYEVCERLKADPRTRDIPVIFISALHEIEDKVKGFKVGGVDYITKPFQFEEVLARVETHLALRRYQSKLQDLNRRYAQELALAGDLQASFIPAHPPVIPGYELAVALRPALETSGDFYDVFLLPGGGYGLLMADVVDKGASAALLMALSRTIIRTQADEFPDEPAHVLEEANRRIISDAGASRFVTVFYCALHPEISDVVYCNAGHNPPILIKAGSTSVKKELEKTGVPLGILEEEEWGQDSVRLDEGDVLVLYTDGVTESQNPAGEFYGVDRLVKTIQAHRARSAESIRDAVFEGVEQFRGAAPRVDDMAVVIVKRALGS
jgi:sigma-B regulation protein RsbU (phosphoserine phosphatase)